MENEYEIRVLDIDVEETEKNYWKLVLLKKVNFFKKESYIIFMKNIEEDL